MSKRTFASVTEVECSCGYLAQSAADPYSGIKFDPRLNEYSFHYSNPDGCTGALSIYHCPFCGGAAPESLRHALFAEVSLQEEQRLRTLFSAVATVEQVLEKFGPPDDDQPQGEGVQTPTTNGHLSPIVWFRVLVYSRLSDTTNVHVKVLEDGRVRPSFEGKYVGATDAGA